MTRAVLTPRAVWWRARAPVGLSKLCQLLALSAWHGIAQERSAGSSIKQISAPCAWRESPEPTPGPRVPEKKATQFIFRVSKHEIHCTLQPQQA